MAEKVTFKEVRVLVFLVAEKLKWREKIPPFETVDKAKLESSLQTPFQSFDGKEFYESLSEKGAALFYFLIKNHPFQNGNKRIAIVATFFFFFKNKKWVRIPTEDLYEISKTIAESDSKEKESVFRVITELFERYLTDL